SGELRSSSTDELAEMYRFPKDEKTWWIGDGLIMLENGGYYMTIDVGFLRLIYYFGLPLTILYMLIQLVYAYYAGKNFNNAPFRLGLFTVVVFVIILNFKTLING